MLKSKPLHDHYLSLITKTSEEEKMERRRLVNLLIKVELVEGNIHLKIGTGPSKS
jgi:hypothetical protein